MSGEYNYQEEIKTKVTDVQTKVNDGTYGLAALQSTVAKEATLGTPVTDVSTDIAAVKTVADAIQTDTTEIGVAGAGLTAIITPMAKEATLGTPVTDVSTDIAAVKTVADAVQVVTDALDPLLPASGTLATTADIEGNQLTTFGQDTAVSQALTTDWNDLYRSGVLANDVKLVSIKLTLLNSSSTAPIYRITDGAVEDLGTKIYPFTTDLAIETATLREFVQPVQIPSGKRYAIQVKCTAVGTDEAALTELNKITLGTIA